MTKHLVNGMEGQKGAEYGDLFWMIGLPDGRQVAVNADSIDVDFAGTLLTKSHSPKREDGRTFPGLVLPAGQWEYVYAASALDGTAVAVDRIDESPPQS